MGTAGTSSLVRLPAQVATARVQYGAYSNARKSVTRAPTSPQQAHAINSGTDSLYTANQKQPFLKSLSTLESSQPSQRLRVHHSATFSSTIGSKSPNQYNHSPAPLNEDRKAPSSSRITAMTFTAPFQYSHTTGGYRSSARVGGGRSRECPDNKNTSTTNNGCAVHVDQTPPTFKSSMSSPNLYATHQQFKQVKSTRSGALPDNSPGHTTKSPSIRSDLGANREIAKTPSSDHKLYMPVCKSYSIVSTAASDNRSPSNCSYDRNSNVLTDNKKNDIGLERHDENLRNLSPRTQVALPFLGDSHHQTHTSVTNAPLGRYGYFKSGSYAQDVHRGPGLVKYSGGVADVSSYKHAYISRPSFISSRDSHHQKSVWATSRSGIPAAAVDTPKLITADSNSQPEQFLPVNCEALEKDPASQFGHVLISPRGQEKRYAYKLKKILQNAIFGKVLLAQRISLNDGTPVSSQNSSYVAIKVLFEKLIEKRRHIAVQEGVMAEKEFRHEFRSHPHLVSCLDHWSGSNDTIMIVTAFAEGLDLFEYMKTRRRPLNENQAAYMFEGILKAAAYLHSVGVAFRDHSLENVLVYSDPETKMAIPKIADPGQAIRVKSSQSQLLTKGTLVGKSYRAPELYFNEVPYNPFLIDSFALGWMLFFCLAKVTPFDKALPSDLHWYHFVNHGKIKELLLKFHPNVTFKPETISLLQALLHPNPKNRPLPADALSHEFFQIPKQPVFLP